MSPWPRPDRHSGRRPPQSIDRALSEGRNRSPDRYAREGNGIQLATSPANQINGSCGLSRIARARDLVVNKAVAAPGDRLDDASRGPAVVEGSAENRYLHRDIGALDHTPPRDLQDLVARDDISMPVDQEAENFKRPRPDDDGSEAAISVLARQETAAPIKAKAAERSRPRNVRPLPRLRPDGEAAVRRPNPSVFQFFCNLFLPPLQLTRAFAKAYSRNTKQEGC